MSFKQPLTLTVATLATLLSATINAETVEGLLEKGATHSALFTVSPESGDLVGYVVKNQSSAGKAILKNCLPRMLAQFAKPPSRR